MEKFDKFTVEEEFSAAHNQFLYKGGFNVWSALSSLEYPYFFFSMNFILVFFLVFYVTYVYSDSNALSFTIGILFCSWVIFMWGYQIYIFATLSYYKVNTKILTIGIFLYICTILENGVLYAIIRRTNQNVFVGLETDLSDSEIIWAGCFLSGETIAGLGTGAIFPNNISPYGFLVVGINSIQGYVLLPLFFSTLAIIFQKRMKTRIEEEETKGNTQYFYRKYYQWMYYGKLGRIVGIIFSLEFPFFFGPVIISSVLWLIFFLVFLYTDNEGAIISLGTIFYVWVWGLWAFQLFILITQSYYKVNSHIISIFAFLFSLTLLQNTVTYSVIRFLNPGAFSGMIGDFSKLSIFGLCMFLAVETSTGLGTGAIFAFPVTPWSYLLILLNSMQYIIASSFLLVVFLLVFNRGLEKRIELEKRVEDKRKV